MTGDNKSNSDSALSHLRVIELGDIPASYATRWLADLGADVIKVELPGGDPNRWLPPFALWCTFGVLLLLLGLRNEAMIPIVAFSQNAVDRELGQNQVHVHIRSLGDSRYARNSGLNASTLSESDRIPAHRLAAEALLVFGSWYDGLSFQDGHFVTLLRAENLDTLPQYLADQLKGFEAKP